MYIWTHTQIWNLLTLLGCDLVFFIYKLCSILLSGQLNFPPSACCVLGSSSNRFMPIQEKKRLPGRLGVGRAVQHCRDRETENCTIQTHLKCVPEEKKKWYLHQFVFLIKCFLGLDGAAIETKNNKKEYFL